MKDSVAQLCVLFNLPFDQSPLALVSEIVLSVESSSCYYTIENPICKSFWPEFALVLRNPPLLSTPCVALCERRRGRD